ncbi:MAG: Cys-rich protein [Spirochaetia bacterium]|nr:Cys-rich protein [Spirochaetia bacterium]
MVRKLLVAAFMTGVLALGTAELSANNCPAACDLFASCTIKKAGRTPTADESAKLKGGCMATCNKKTAAVEACYAKAKSAANSCGTYEQCVSAAVSK